MKENKKEEDHTSKAAYTNKVFYQRLQNLYGKTCDIQFLKWYLYIIGTNAPQRVIVEEVDQEWVLLKLVKSKKQEKLLIRIDTIKDIVEIS